MEPAAATLLAIAGLAFAVAGAHSLPSVGRRASAALRSGPRRWPAAAVLVASFLTAARPASSAVAPPTAVDPAEDIRLGEADRAGPAQPDETTLAPEPGPEYVVRPGDSLWAIACRTLAADRATPPSNSEVDRHWRLIYEANRGVIGDDPDLIFPGQRLSLPGSTHGRA